MQTDLPTSAWLSWLFFLSTSFDSATTPLADAMIENKT